MAVRRWLFKIYLAKVLTAAAVQTRGKTPLHKYTTSTEFLDWYFIYKQIQLLLHSHHILHFTDGCGVFCLKELLGYLRGGIK